MRVVLWIMAAWTLVGALAAAQAARESSPAYDFERALAAHPYFGRLALERVERGPYLFLFQKVAGASPQRATLYVDQLAPVLDATLEVFTKDVAGALRLEPRADHRRFALVVLASRAELESCQRTTKLPWHGGAWALYDPGLRVAVVYEEALGQPRSWSERAQAARHAFLHGCQQAYCALDAPPPLSGWLLEGMAEALACTTADPRATRPDADALREMVRDAQDERRAFAHLRTLEELLELDEPARLGEYFKASTPAAFVPLDVSRSWQAFYRQAALLFAYLWADGNGARRGALVAYLGAVLGGNGGAAEFEACFLGAGAAEIERGFLDWLVREHQRAYPVERIDVERVRAALKRGGKGMEPPPPPLALADLTGEERLALALAQWAHGDERVAGAALEELGAADADARLAAPLRERVERERRRFSRWTAQRDAYLSSFVGGTSSFAFKLDGKGFKAKVLAFADGVLTLEANRSGRERLAVAEIDALELAQAMPRAGPEDWARLLPYVLREDARAKKLVKEDGGEGSALLADAQADYPARLALGRVAASLLALSKAPEPRTEEALEALLTEARTVLAQGASLALLERKRAALLGRVRAWLETKYELGGPAALLAGKVETLAGERVRITYAFDDPRELEDFDPTLYPVLATKGWGVLKAPDQPFRVEGGTLVGQGRATLHSWLDLVPPYTLRYDLTFVDGEEKGATRWFALGVADDRRERFAWGVNLDVLQVQDGESEAQARGGIERWFMDSAYAMELAHDGKQITLRCETKECSLPAGARREGGFFLYVHSEYPVRLAQLEVEAKLLPSSLRRLRALRVERDLAGY